MNIIHRHFPVYVDSEPCSQSFNTLEELLNIDWVNIWATCKDFYRFSISVGNSRPMLMAELRDGYSWWVLGYLENLDGIDLPKWEAKYKD